MATIADVVSSARRMFPFVAALCMSACGGGFSVGFGSGFGFDDAPPSVSVASSVSTVQAGQSLRLVAAAADENGIDNVAFYRLDNNNPVLLGSDGAEPFEWTTTVPNDGRTTLSVFARATDNAGNRADSSVLTIAVTP
ncbi:MAG: hypothetical protein E6H58_03450 [Betaproteobacteria bacterium]|jgi:hypothetical protein|nr:MAG: hypothetical protein E6H65_16690 [Betaproteobacteria bacterium]TMH35626.1 MAG: hypothetical protein E6H58_03450 [Betaproteobacteria bacterium]